MRQMVKRASRILAQVYRGDERRTVHVFRDGRGRYQVGTQGQYVGHRTMKRDRVTGRITGWEG